MGATETRVASLVREAIATAASVDAASLLDSTPLLATNMDSLTLVTVLSHVEHAFGIDFSADELVAVLRAANVGELTAAVARKVCASGEANRREAARNARCVADDDAF